MDAKILILELRRMSAKRDRERRHGLGLKYDGIDDCCRIMLEAAGTLEQAVEDLRRVRACAICAYEKEHHGGCEDDDALDCRTCRRECHCSGCQNHCNWAWKGTENR